MAKLKIGEKSQKYFKKLINKIIIWNNNKKVW